MNIKWKLPVQCLNCLVSHRVCTCQYQSSINVPGGLTDFRVQWVKWIRCVKTICLYWWGSFHYGWCKKSIKVSWQRKRERERERERKAKQETAAVAVVVALAFPLSVMRLRPANGKAPRCLSHGAAQVHGLAGWWRCRFQGGDYPVVDFPRCI